MNIRRSLIIIGRNMIIDIILLNIKTIIECLHFNKLRGITSDMNNPWFKRYVKIEPYIRKSLTASKTMTLYKYYNNIRFGPKTSLFFTDDYSTVIYPEFDGKLLLFKFEDSPFEHQMYWFEIIDNNSKNLTISIFKQTLFISLKIIEETDNL